MLQDGAEDEDSVLVVAQDLVVAEDQPGSALDEVDVAELEHSLHDSAAELVEAVADDFGLDFLNQSADLGGASLRLRHFLHYSGHAAAVPRLLDDLSELYDAFLDHMVAMVIKGALAYLALHQDLRKHLDLLAHREHLQSCLYRAAPVLMRRVPDHVALQPLEYDIDVLAWQVLLAQWLLLLDVAPRNVNNIRIQLLHNLYYIVAKRILNQRVEARSRVLEDPVQKPLLLRHWHIRILQPFLNEP